MKLLLRTKYFHAYLTEIEACSRLKEPNQFLLRFSSQPGYFSVSYVTPEQMVEHTRIRFDQASSVFRSHHFEEKYHSLQAFVGNLKRTRYPVECPDFVDILGGHNTESGYSYSTEATIFMDAD